MLMQQNRSDTSDASMQARLDALDDECRHNNLQIRGIAEPVTTAKLPHFLRLLFSALLPPRQAKNTLVCQCPALPSVIQGHIRGCKDD
ncbi:Hypothetical predicted protein [Pelobates cultripes]|uniref:Uncharacterized protein n=1 Tax=Pelobates cultripes TaxID=61616 RepID=A0AAD1T154_PELCU|nr:Hypothetical predicted protein [Pelobates cultripes]